MIVRPATVDDIPELTRLRELLFGRLADSDNPEPAWEWRDQFTMDMKERLGGGELGVFVVDGDDGDLAACGIGVVQYRLPTPYQANALAGYVLGMVTDPAYRGQGYARLVMKELLKWFEENDVARVELHATPEAAPLYRSMGFRDHQIALTWHAP